MRFTLLAAVLTASLVYGGVVEPRQQPSATSTVTSTTSTVSSTSVSVIGDSCAAKPPGSCGTGADCDFNSGQCTPLGAPSSTTTVSSTTTSTPIGGDCFALGPNGCSSGSTCVSATPSATCSRINNSVSQSGCRNSGCPTGTICDKEANICVPLVYSSSSTVYSSSSTTSSRPISSTPNSGADRVLAGAGVGALGLVAAALF